MGRCVRKVFQFARAKAGIARLRERCAGAAFEERAARAPHRAAQGADLRRRVRGKRRSAPRMACQRSTAQCSTPAPDRQTRDCSTRTERPTLAHEHSTRNPASCSASAGQRSTRTRPRTAHASQRVPRTRACSANAGQRSTRASGSAERFAPHVGGHRASAARGCGRPATSPAGCRRESAAPRSELRARPFQPAVFGTDGHR